MVKVKSLGLMEDVTKVNINTIRNMDSVPSTGQMAENTLDIGKMVSNMVEDSTSCQMVRRRSENGFKAKRSSGLKRQVY